MRNIAHISDLHFGRFDPTVREGLFATLLEIRPHFVIVSGDLTQRARKEEFQEAKEFLGRLEAEGIPYLAIPGNHDIVPFTRPLSRLLKPFKRYREHFSEQTQVFFADEEVAVTSINTVRGTQIENGRLNRVQAEEVRMWLSMLPKHVVKIVVTHHPLFRNPIKRLRTPAWHLGGTMSKLHEVGVDVFISGHLHHSYATREQALFVQAGTVSSRLRGEAPSFNLLTVGIPHLTVKTFHWKAESSAFSPVHTEAFVIKNKPLPKVKKRA